MRRITCKVCNTPFVALRATGRFCSTACRMKAHREWKKFKSSQLGEKAIHGVTLLAAIDSVTADNQVNPSGGNDPVIVKIRDCFHCCKCGVFHWEKKTCPGCGKSVAAKELYVQPRPEGGDA